MIVLADPTLVVLVGVSGSGKSTWASEHFAPDLVVSSDRLRAVVGEGEADQAASADAFALLYLIVEARTRRRLTTVVDSTGLDARTRRTLREIAARHDVECVAVVVATAPAEARRRNAARERRVPAAVITRQLEDFAVAIAALPDEGFAEVIQAEPVRLVAPSVRAAERALRPIGESAAGSGPAGRVVGSVAAGRVGDSGRLPASPKFGLQLSSFPAPGGRPLGDHLSDVARRAEDAGFDSLWVMDHMRQIPQLGRAWEDMPESVTTLGFLARATSRVTLGCLVHAVTFRNVGLLAKSVATLDVLSGGRAWCGLGAGGFEPEHLAYGWHFPPDTERLDLLEEALQALALLWGPGAPSFDGRHVTIPEALSYPRPLTGRVPVLVGGGGERRTLRLVAQYADACNLFGDAAQVSRKLDVLRGHCADVGRDPSSIEVTHLSTVLVGRDDADLAERVQRRRPARGHSRWTATTNPGTVSDHVLRVRALLAAGVDHVIVAVDDVWREGSMEVFAEVIEAVRAARVTRQPPG